MYIYITLSKPTALSRFYNTFNVFFYLCLFTYFNSCFLSFFHTFLLILPFLFPASYFAF